MSAASEEAEAPPAPSRPTHSPVGAACDDAYPVSELPTPVRPRRDDAYPVSELPTPVLPRPSTHHARLFEEEAKSALVPGVVRRSSSEGRQLGELVCGGDPPPPSFFFTGCAWGCAFHVGAYRGVGLPA